MVVDVRASELRRKYVEFFKEKGHDIMPSASLVPQDDASLLWINSGMAPLKKYFDGRVVPNNPRMTNSQKCIRTNDIENVGRTARHQTFFEMLGNFSIGDYFKRESIHWAWEFVTERLGIESERLSVTIHPEDDEAFLIWHREIGLPEDKILRLEENFWDIGEGPCGPNSEIFYDRGAGIGCGRSECDASCDCDRHLEIWNLVFSQYNHNPDGSYTSLPKKNIDTGMGLERTASVLQGVATNFDTDLFRPIIDKAASILGVHYGEKLEQDVSLKIIADHVRTVVFAITDGVLPSNEGRGYVIRRLLRRAVRNGKKLGYSKPFLYTLTDIVGEVMADYYPEVLKSRARIEEVIRREEERFHETLADGEAMLARLIERLEEEKQSIIAGEDAFRLYDTYGFPLDLTEEIAQENGIGVDRDGFEIALEEQRTRARNARHEVDSMQVQTGLLRDLNVGSQFVGYSEWTVPAKLEVLIANNELVERAGLGEHVQVILDRTPFYAESGGQVADQGMIFGNGFELRVMDVQKAPGGQHLHHCEVMFGEVAKGASVTAAIDAKMRADITKNHTATHLLHKALREVLGGHVAQAGSMVQGDRLRFDFSHNGSMTKEQMDKVERLVNEQIWLDEVVEIEEMELDEAKGLGAMALFGEKYGEVVRVVKAGNYSIELCGGCHVLRTGQINLFKLVSETGIGSGIRRVEAVTGEHAFEYFKMEEKLLVAMSEQLHAHPAQLPERVEGLMGQVKTLEKQSSALTSQVGKFEALQLLDKVATYAKGQALISMVNAMDVEGLRSTAEELKARQPDLLLFLLAKLGDKLQMIAVVPKTQQAQGIHAGKLIKEIAEGVGGSGGGKPDIAQAGAKDPSRWNEALKLATIVVTRQLSE